MNPTMSQYDPWGPISSTLYSINDSELVENVVGFTGLKVPWPVLDDRTGYSHRTRIRAYKPVIQAAYDALEDEEKGKFAEKVAKGFLNHPIIQFQIETKERLIESLNDIGWTIAEDGALATQDALVSEQFFPAGTHYDAYVAIREILVKATSDIVIVDAYIGSSIFPTLSAIAPSKLAVKLLTASKNLKADFHVEATKFQQQFTGVQFEVRTTTDFHDRFIAIDDSDFYHVGASVKDARKRAFLVSRLQDQPIIAALRHYLDQAWNKATPVSLS